MAVIAATEASSTVPFVDTNELRRLITRIVRRTTEDQQVPEQVEDPSAIERIARIFRQADDGKRGGKR